MKKKKGKNICTNWIYKPSNDVDMKFRNANTFKKARIRAAAPITRARSFEQKNWTKKYTEYGVHSERRTKI